MTRYRLRQQGAVVDLAEQRPMVFSEFRQNAHYRFQRSRREQARSEFRVQVGWTTAVRNLPATSLPECLQDHQL